MWIFFRAYKITIPTLKISKKIKCQYNLQYSSFKTLKIKIFTATAPGRPDVTYLATIFEGWKYCGIVVLNLEAVRWRELKWADTWLLLFKMPKSCCVFNFSNNCKTNLNVQYYVIPNDKDRRQRWLRAINRIAVDDDGKIVKGKLWSSKSKYNYVRSRHFIWGKQS